MIRAPIGVWLAWRRHELACQGHVDDAFVILGHAAKVVSADARFKPTLDNPQWPVYADPSRRSGAGCRSVCSQHPISRGNDVAARVPEMSSRCALPAMPASDRCGSRTIG